MSIVKDKARADALTIGSFEPDLLNAADETGAAVHYGPGTYEWLIWGTFGGATAQLQQSPDNKVTWIDFNVATATANGRITGIPISSAHIRVKITSAGVSTNLYSSFKKVS